MRNKLETIIEPDGDIGTLNLGDIIDSEELQAMMEDFYKITQIGGAILDISGNVLVGVAWKDICAKFHRVHPDTAKNCLESDLELATGVPVGIFKAYRCKNNMWDMVSPIKVGEKHLGNIYIGQFFYEDEHVDCELFRKQARQHGFDETEYLAALDRVPRLKRETVESAMTFYAKLAGMISSLSYGKIKLSRDIVRRKQAEKALQEKNDLLERIFDSNFDLIALSDLEGNFTLVGKSHEILGYDSDYLIGRNVMEFVHPEDLAFVGNEFSRFLKSDENRKIDYRYKRMDGEYLWFETMGTKLKDKKGNPEQILFNTRNITERKRSEEALNHSRRLMKYIIEHTRSAIAVHDRDLKYIYVSQRYLHDYKVKDEDVIGKHHYDVFPDLPQKWRDVHRRALAGDVLSAEDDRYEREDGSVEWTRWECRPWYEKNGVIGGIIVYTEVITERKQIEQEMIEQKDMLAAIYRNAPLVMMVVNAERRIQQINGFAAQFANRDAEEMLGLRGGEALHCLYVLDDPRGCGFGEFCRQCVIRNTVLDTLETGQTHLQIEAPYYFKGQGNETRNLQFLMSTTPIQVKGERMALVTLQDITERKRSEAEKEKLQSQLLQAQKMESVGRLAGGIAHDFNNMLGVILGCAEMAMDQVDPAHPLFADLEEIRKAAERSANLTRQLLTFARKQTVAPKVIDLNETVEGMLKMLRRLIGEDIDLLWMPGKNLGPVKMDPSQIDQILANLCVNSRDAIAGVGKLTIETGRVRFDEEYCADHAGFIPGEFIMLAVSDNGCGMDPETVGHLFEPFFTTKAVGKGTGLGLASVYGAVKQNNGFVNVYSEPGQGTTFRIYLPRHRAGTPLRADAATAKPTARGSETILLVEDEPSILRMAATMLERLGYVAIAAETPGEAIRLAREHGGPIDLLVTDVVMPEMNGRDLAKNILSVHPDMKRLFMSGYTANVIAHHGVLDEGVHFIQKPFSLKDLEMKLREVLEDNNSN